MPVFPADLLMIRSYCARNSDEFTNVLAEKLVSRLGVPSDQANVAASNCCRQIIANGLKGAVVGGLVGALASSEVGGLAGVPGVFVGKYAGEITTILGSERCEDVRSAFSKAWANQFD